MFRSRKVQITIGVIALLAVAFFVLWFGVAPSRITARVERAIEARTGLDAEVGGATLLFRGVIVRDVHVRSDDGSVDITIDAVGARANLVSLIREGTGAVRHLQARGVRVRLDLSGTGVTQLREHMAARRTAGGGGGGGGGVSRVLEARRADVELRDAHGVLASTTGASFLHEGSQITLGAGRLETAPEVSGASALVGASATLIDVPDVGWQLQEASIEGGRVVWEQSRADAADGPPRFVDRVVAALAAVRGEPLVEPEPESEPGEPDDEDLDEPGAADPPPEGEATEAEAITHEDTNEVTSPEGSSRGLMDVLFARLAEEASISVTDVDVEARVSGRAPVRLSNLSLTVEREANEGDTEWFHLLGEGQPSGEGHLRWDLRIAPEEAHGEGELNFESLSLALVAPLGPDVPWYEPDRAMLSGHLHINAESRERLALSGRVALRDGALSSPRLAPVPVFDVGFDAQGEGFWLPRQRRLEVTTASVRVGDAELRLSGFAESNDEHYALQAHAVMPRTECSAAIRAIPEDLLGDLAAFSWQGYLAGRGNIAIDSNDLENATLEVDIANECEFVAVPAAADLRRFARPFRHEVLEPDGTLFSMTTGPGTANWTSIHAMSPFFIHSVIGHEDGGFFNHTGFSLNAIERSLRRNLEEGRFVTGASTITMQLAKNLFLHREKTVARKVQEMLLTWWLESALPKRKILELYLNVIEYGHNVYGVRRAARHYFGREPDELSPAESAFLACVLPAPKRFGAVYSTGRLSPVMRARLARFMRHMRSRRRMDQAALDYGLAELESFRFHRGGPPPDHRTIAGRAGRLPFATRLDAAAEWAALERQEAPPEDRVAP